MSTKVAPKVEATPPPLSYEFKDGKSGLITRTDENGTLEVATYDEKKKVLRIVKEHNNFRGAVTRWLGEADYKINSTIFDGDDEDPQGGPPCPPMHPAMGDKTPSVVKWWKDNRPAEFKTKYGITGQTEDGQLIGSRRTYLTAKPGDKGPDGIALVEITDTGVENTTWDADTSIPGQPKKVRK